MGSPSRPLTNCSGNNNDCNQLNSLGHCQNEPTKQRGDGKEEEAVIRRNHKIENFSTGRTADRIWNGIKEEKELQCKHVE